MAAIWRSEREQIKGARGVSLAIAFLSNSLCCQSGITTQNIVSLISLLTRYGRLKIMATSTLIELRTPEFPYMSPKLYVSYSWTTRDHEAWVLRLATELRESGVDVILDKWDLKEGHDAHAFMERMVTDETIKKVALICDATYVSKANSRSGGVGTETQIITPDIYAKQDQSKFVAVIVERDED